MKLFDQECHCGHLMSAHEDALGGIVKGHGECKLCECNKFVWKRFIDLESLCFDCRASNCELHLIDDGVALCDTCYENELDTIQF